MQQSLVIVFAALLSACTSAPEDMQLLGNILEQDVQQVDNTNAQFAVWVEGEQLDFSQEKYMSDPFTPDQKKVLHQDLRLEGGDGSVIHIYRPNQTLGSFLSSLGYDMTKDECLVTDTGEQLCSEDGNRWRMFVNEKERPLDPDLFIKHGDSILLTYGSPFGEIQRQLSDITHNLCMRTGSC